MELSSSTLIADLLNRYPLLVPVFIQRRMACVGCGMARFETLEAAAQVYGLDLDQFLEQIGRIIAEIEK